MDLKLSITYTVRKANEEDFDEMRTAIEAGDDAKYMKFFDQVEPEINLKIAATYKKKEYE